MLTIVSSIFSYWGLIRNFGEFAFVFACVIFLVLLSGNIAIHHALTSNRGKTSKGVLLLLLGVVFSFASTFNYIYTRSMTKDVNSVTVVEQHNKFLGNLVNSSTSLSKSSIAKEYFQNFKFY